MHGETPPVSGTGLNQGNDARQGWQGEKPQASHRHRPVKGAKEGEESPQEDIVGEDRKKEDVEKEDVQEEDFEEEITILTRLTDRRQSAHSDQAQREDQVARPFEGAIGRRSDATCN